MLRKRWILWPVLAFVGFYLYTHPTNAAHAVRGAVGTVQTGAERAATFVSAVVK